MKTVGIPKEISLLKVTVTKVLLTNQGAYLGKNKIVCTKEK
jgi:hypothetical protein